MRFNDLFFFLKKIVFLFAFRSNAPASMPLGWIKPGQLHDVLITGLKPETLYQYQVGTGGVLRTDWQRFVSAPTVGATTSVDFL